MSGALKPTTINATFFEHNERSEGEAGAQGKKARKLFGKKGAAKPGKVYRDLDDENARHDDATPASTQPSTRRSSVTAVHEQVCRLLSFRLCCLSAADYVLRKYSRKPARRRARPRPPRVPEMSTSSTRTRSSSSVSRRATPRTRSTGRVRASGSSRSSSA